MTTDVLDQQDNLEKLAVDGGTIIEPEHLHTIRNYGHFLVTRAIEELGIEFKIQSDKTSIIIQIIGASRQ